MEEEFEATLELLNLGFLAIFAVEMVRPPN
jgi:hypothetical protein